MWWIAFTVPLMVLGVALAVVPVAWTSVRHCRLEEEEWGPPPASLQATAPWEPAAPWTFPSAAPDTLPAAVARPIRLLEVQCPACMGHLAGEGERGLLEAVERHAWRAHGVPSRAQISKSVRVA